MAGRVALTSSLAGVLLTEGLPATAPASASMEERVVSFILRIEEKMEGNETSWRVQRLGKGNVQLVLTALCANDEIEMSDVAGVADDGGDDHDNDPVPIPDHGGLEPSLIYLTILFFLFPSYPHPAERSWPLPPHRNSTGRPGYPASAIADDSSLNRTILSVQSDQPPSPLARTRDQHQDQA